MASSSPGQPSTGSASANLLLETGGVAYGIPVKLRRHQLEDKYFYIKSVPSEVLSHATALVAPARVHLLSPAGYGAEPGEVSVQQPGVISSLINCNVSNKLTSLEICSL